MKRPWFLLLAGAFLGLLGDFLMRGSLGINVPVWTAAFLLVSARTTNISPIHSGLALPMMFFAGCVAWRESVFLTASNTLVVLGLATLPHLQHCRVVLRNALVSDYLRGMGRMTREVCAGSYAYFASELPSVYNTSPWQRHAMSVAVGLGLTVPVIAVFGTLYSSADPGFERMLQSVWHVDAGATLKHAIFSAAIGMAAVGYLRGLLTPESFADEAGEHAQPTRRYGLIEITIPLTGLVLLSGAFVAFQIPYLFGGQTIVNTTTGLSYATYARRGFFELTTATSLVIPVLLTADRFLKQSTTNVRVFRIVALVQICLVGVLMTSAMHRMGLYWQEYGLTTTRIYASTMMLWVGAVLVWFAMTVLRGRKHRFAFGALVLGLVTLAALNFANPEHLIARVNIARAAEGRPVDARYLSALSTDAYPPIMSNLSRIPIAERCVVLSSIRQRVHRAPNTWKGWTLSKHRAWKSWKTTAADLQAPCPT